jgi:uncharacterized protein (TIGR00251 family)
MPSCTFDIHLKPRAKKNNISIGNNGVLEISVTSPPIDNKANEHLIKLLSQKLKVPKSSIEIIRGNHSREKSIEILSISRENALERLNSVK